MGASRGNRPPRTGSRLHRDVLAAGLAAAVFSVSLGAASVALPLLALRSGYSAAEVGALTAVSAVAQMTSRMFLGMVMRRWPDWILVTTAAAILAVSNGIVALSAAVAPFVLAELLQGVARACYWTGSQTHFVRGPGRAMSALATVNFISSLGLLAGPVLAGILSERSPTLALGAASGVALLATLPTFFFDRLPPFVPPPNRPPGRLWRRPGVDLGCWAGVTAGAWRGLLTSYVPVALDAARQSSATIGALVSVANGASVAAAALVGRVRERGAARGFVLGIVAAGGGTALAALVADRVVLAAVVLAVSGLGAGALQTIGPAMATDAVHPEERGDAIAVAGTFRAAALFLAPLAVAGMLGLIGVVGAMAVAGGAITLPAALSGRRRPAPETTSPGKAVA